MADRLNSFLCGVLLASLPITVLAQSATGSLADPTRPPVAFFEPAAAAQVEIGPVLQSVVIPAKGKPVAVIGGQEVLLGGLYGERRLIRLSEREAVLEGPDGVEHLPLTPGIEKTNIKNLTTRSSAAKRARRGSQP